MKIVFLGTGDIGLPSLKALADSADHELVAVFTQPDRPFGRKGELKAPEVKVFAESIGVPAHQPEKIRRGEALETLRSYEPEVIVVVAYGQILPKSVLELPSVACINLHASILPKHRGAAPIQAAILAGDKESGMTVMHIDVGLDSGDIILLEKFTLAANETGGSLHDRLADIGPTALMKALKQLADGTAPRTPQDHDAATHIGKLDRSDGVIDWYQSAVEIERRVRAFDPWPGTSTVLNGSALKVFPPVEIVEQGTGKPGEVLEATKEGLLVACGGGGALRVVEIQPAGKKRMTAAAYFAGRPVEAGIMLG